MKWLLPGLLVLVLVACEARPEVALRNRQEFVCSGVVVAPGRILTAGHCTGEPLFYEGRRIESKPERVGVDAVELSVPWAQGQVQWGHAAQVGDTIEIISYGCSRGARAERRVGKVTDVWWVLVYTDVPGCVGDSGGPLYDAQHRLIGLVTYLDKSTQHLVARRVWP